MYNHAHYGMIRRDILDAMDIWGRQHIPRGDFLMAVFSNDLMEAATRADQDNLAALAEICRYVFNELPAGCHGSSDKVDSWITAGERPQTDILASTPDGVR